MFVRWLVLFESILTFGGRYKTNSIVAATVAVVAVAVLLVLLVQPLALLREIAMGI